MDMSVKRKVTWIILIALVAGIKVFSAFPDAVERYYSTGFYPLTARLQRILFGWIPFSIGDILYGIAACWLLLALVAFISTLVRGNANRAYFFSCARRIVAFLLWVYVIFNLAWGLNYDRKGIADQLQLQVKPYSTDELTDLVRLMAQNLNALDSASLAEREALKHKRNLFSGAVRSYGQLASRDERFAYPSASVKPSIFSYFGNYLGFGGYYNPFSGEAQVNVTLPVFVQPYTTCHEIGHQLGYAK